MNKEKLKQNIVKAFNKTIKEAKLCVCCDKHISNEEFINGDGACYKCWEK